MVAGGRPWEKVHEQTIVTDRLPGRRLATGSLTFAHLASPVLRLAHMPDPREKAPGDSGPPGRKCQGLNQAAPVLANLPRSAFLNRDSLPLSRISRAILE